MTRAAHQRALVLGAGVNGLSCACALRSAGLDVEIWTRDDPDTTTSAVSAAFWYPFAVAPLDRVRAWARAALQDFLQILGESSHQGEHGIVDRQVIELFPDAAPAPGWREMLPGLRPADPHELRAGRRSGWCFRAPVIDTSRYLPWLIRQLSDAGVDVQRRAATSLDEALSHSDLVINTTGLGARTLADDPRVFPIRGELVRCRAAAAHPTGDLGAVWLDEHAGQIRYLVPRVDDFILGGSFEAHRDDRLLDADSADAIVSGCAALAPSVGELMREEHRVGFRPARHEVRLELERRAGGTIAHNYGHGGAGVTLSWGCARALLGQLGLRAGDRPWSPLATSERRVDSLSSPPSP